MIQKEAANPLNSISLSLQGFIVGIFLIFPAFLSMDVFGMHLGFNFLPVAAVFYWPRAASYSWSLLGVFLFGFLYDLASASPIGMWTLAFLILFIVLDGGSTLKGGLGRNMLGYGLSVFLCLVIIFLVGRFSIGQWPHFNGLMANAIASIAVFPLFYWVRILLRALTGQVEPSGLRQ